MEEGIWGRDQTMVVSAFRYCLGRQTYIVSDCADWLCQYWNKFNQGSRDIIQRELEQAFSRDKEARENGSRYTPLGGDCDRRAWERVRELYLPTE